MCKIAKWIVLFLGIASLQNTISLHAQDDKSHPQEWNILSEKEESILQEYIFIVDLKYTVDFTALEKLIRTCISDLDSNDRFNLIISSSEPLLFQERSIAATLENRETAISFIKSVNLLETDTWKKPPLMYSLVSAYNLLQKNFGISENFVIITNAPDYSVKKDLNHFVQKHCEGINFFVLGIKGKNELEGMFYKHIKNLASITQGTAAIAEYQNHERKDELSFIDIDTALHYRPLKDTSRYTSCEIPPRGRGRKIFLFNPHVYNQNEIRLLTGRGREMNNDRLDPKIYDISELRVYPKFPGGEEAFDQFLQQHLGYPKKALQDSLSVIVIAEVLINPYGRITHIRIVENSDSKPFWKRAKQVIRKMPNWEPGKKIDYVYCKMPLYIPFDVNQ